ncbi:MAG: hypothetical protein LBU77_01895 [Clostridiales bacterium]|jgi:hypothetical protein|nr:hypothetical protein [Clostridiales bacterium]
MLIKNIKTGCVWDITDSGIIKRIKRDPDFEAVDIAGIHTDNNGHVDTGEPSIPEPSGNTGQEAAEQTESNPAEKEVENDGSTDTPKNKAGNKKQ